MRILIIEDEKTVRNELKKLLENALYHVEMITDFSDVVQQIIDINPDLILLDLNLPNMNGQMICQELRQTANTPIIFLTSNNDMMTELNSILLGGDDFITKPYHPSLLLARIQSLLRRAQPLEQDTLVYKGVTIDLKTYKVEFQGKSEELTKTEFKLLHYLFQRKEELITRIDIITYLWENDVFIDDNALSVNVTRLRNKLTILGLADFIKTKRGVGYQI